MWSSKVQILKFCTELRHTSSAEETEADKWKELFLLLLLSFICPNKLMDHLPNFISQSPELETVVSTTWARVCSIPGFNYKWGAFSFLMEVVVSW